MISIIISSYKPNLLTQIKENIANTIGNVVYEILAIHNPGIMGICEAYNNGAKQAKYDKLLFIHEDILFETINWGNILIEYLSNNTIGCIGVAGSTVKTRFPIAWWDLIKYKKVNINQFIPRLNQSKNYHLKNDAEVKILDGVFIAVRKSIWGKIKFNQVANPSFHGYDVEFSLDVSNHYKNLVTNKILLIHFSEGSPNKDWFKELIRIYQKSNFKNNADFLDLVTIELFLRYLVEYNFTKKEKLKVFFSFYNPIDHNIKNNFKVLNLFRFYFNKR